MNSHGQLVRGNQQQRWRWQQSANGHGSSSEEQHRPSRWPVGVTLPIYRPPEEDVYSPWRMFEERVRTGPFGLSRFPSQPHSPVRIEVLDGDADNRVSPRLTQFIRNSPPRIREEWQQLGVQAAAAAAAAVGLEEQEDPGLSEEEFKKAMKKVRKQVYNPPYPRRRAWKRGLFSGRTNGGGNEEEEKEEGKDCTICLEAFVANEQVLVTPCNHMFHSHCLAPWVKSQGKCPVCRYVLCEKKDNALVRSSSNNNNGGVSFSYGYTNSGRELDDELALDLITLIRAMEEALNWISYSRVTPSYH